MNKEELIKLLEEPQIVNITVLDSKRIVGQEAERFEKKRFPKIHDACISLTNEGRVHGILLAKETLLRWLRV